MSPAPELARVLALLSSLHSREARATEGLFSIEGTRLLERALRSEAALEAAVLGASYGADGREAEVVRELERRGVSLHRIDDRAARELCGGRTFGTVQGLVRRSPESSLTAAGDVLVAVDVSDPGNAGALARTALLSNVAGFVAVGTTDPFHPKAARTSMGSIFRLPVLEFDRGGRALESLRGLGFRAVAAVARGGRSLYEVRPSADVPHAVFVGSEAHGLPPELAEACDERWTVPQREDADSFSVNAAASVLCYELARRRSRPSP